MGNVVTAFLLTALMSAFVQISDVSGAEARGRKDNRQVNYLGDDLFPWPWGSECPFPWKDIEGTWKVQGQKGAYYNGHVLTFKVEKEARNSVKFLEVSQYTNQGLLFAEGHGYSEKDKRVVKGLLRTERGNKNYVVMVRSYSREQKSCRSSDLVTAVTFCPVRGKKCLEDSNYVLERIETEE